MVLVNAAVGTACFAGSRLPTPDLAEPSELSEFESWSQSSSSESFHGCHLC
jgi:hypothetical protein